MSAYRVAEWESETMFNLTLGWHRILYAELEVFLPLSIAIMMG